MIECRFCQKTFSKGEHLRRHERSHTGAKPFVCKECQRSFSRQDSLARHEKLHLRRRTGSKEAPSPDTADVGKPVTPESMRSTENDLNDQSTGSTTTITNNNHNNSYEFSSATSDHQQPHVGEVNSNPSLSTAAGAPQPGPSSLTTQPLDLDFDLIWPDSEDLFQTIMSTDSVTQWQQQWQQMPLGTLPFSASPPASDVTSGTPSSFDERPCSIGVIPSGGNHQAVQDVSKMVSNLSSSVTAAAKSTSITSVFLDECLHMFFVKFIPTFPVLHRATFVFRDCAHPLLLNAIAIGSLYLGPKDAVAKGEALWRLAHTAIATSWQTLISQRGTYDACEGVQLVLTAVLGQVYGTLSKNRAIRTTSQAFHSLAFVWARRCGMFDCGPFPPLSSLDLAAADDAEMDSLWRTWVAREIQQRAVLAHFMLDGLISQMSGVPTSVRHATNQLSLPSSEPAFEASSADEWISHMRRSQSVQGQTSFEIPTTTTFRSILRRLFRSPESPWFDTTLSAFSYKVILEGLQSLISDDDCEEEEGGTAVGVPTRSEVRRALNQVYETITLNASLSSADQGETLLRWHSICLETVVNTSLLCRNLCSRYDITQHIWRQQPQSQQQRTPHHTQNSRKLFDLVDWVTTPSARIALLHAMAIQEIVEQLPRGRAHVIHMPSSLFATATVYAVFALAGSPALKIPCSVVWQDVLLDTRCAAAGQTVSSSAPATSASYLSLSDVSNTVHSNSNPSGNNSNGLGVTDTCRYIRGDTLYGLNVTSRNLLYELNSIQKLFRCLFAQWGVAYDMESVVEQWISLCH